MKLDWNDPNSVRTWLQTVSTALRGIAEMVNSLANLVESGMPPAETAPGAPPKAGGPGTRACSLCGKTEAETELYAGEQGNVCPSCTRAACCGLGIRPDEGKDKPSGG